MWNNDFVRTVWREAMKSDKSRQCQLGCSVRIRKTGNRDCELKWPGVFHSRWRCVHGACMKHWLFMLQSLAEKRNCLFRGQSDLEQFFLRKYLNARKFWGSKVCSLLQLSSVEFCLKFFVPLEKVGICSNFKMLSFALDRFALNPFEKMFGWEICAPFFFAKMFGQASFQICSKSFCENV